MKIILTSIGTRGDMEPFLAIGDILKKRGHKVICLFPEQFKDLVEDSDLEFQSLGSKFLELLDTPEGKIAMGGGRFGVKKIKAFIKLIKEQPEASKEMLLLQKEVIDREQPDRVVHHAKTIYPVIWSLKHKNKNTLIVPVPYMHYVKGHPHVAFNKDLGTFFNKLSYKLVNTGLIYSVMKAIKTLELHKKVKTTIIKEALFKSKTIYTISPSLFKRPTYWQSNLKVLGFYERNKQSNWVPTQELLLFIKKHPKILFVTFGSMVNDDALGKTQIILDILQKNKIPAIINTYSGGLVPLETYNNELIHYVKRIPYDWIFPKMYGVIHHGGSGTTHMALKNGCVNLIIPHIIDQYVWNKIIAENNYGPLGIDVKQISVSTLAPKVIDMYSNVDYKNKVIELQQKMKEEDNTEELCKTILND
ncbi:glycosyltransferase [Wenyingzhuangia sp. IMCC45574]